MSYLTSYAKRNPPVRGRGVDEKLALNLPGFHGGAYVRVFVEDTTFRKWRRPAAGAAHPLPHRGLHERDLALVRARLAAGPPELAPQDRHAARRAPALPRRARRRGGAVRPPRAASIAASAAGVLLRCWRGSSRAAGRACPRRGRGPSPCPWRSAAVCAGVSRAKPGARLDAPLAVQRTEPRACPSR